MSSLVADAVAGLGRSEGPADERPLTDQERQQVARLLSDPFAFPQTFKTWLVAFLESSDLTLPISSIQGLGSTLGIGGDGNTSFIQGLLPAGTILGWGSSRVPTGCLRCDGTAYSRTAYARLFKEIGTQWGSGDGVNTFNVPDLRRRFPLGVGSTAFGLGASDNRAENARTPDHYHFFQDTRTVNSSGGTDTQGSHQHSLGVTAPRMENAADGQVAIPTVSGGGTFFTDSQGSHSHGVSVSGTAAIAGNTSGTTGDKDHPAFIAIHFIITT